MKTLVCGDLHCKPYLLDIALSSTTWDKFVFLGDACDNWGASQEDNIQIIKKLIETKQKYGEKFIWLIGNHDWGYFDDSLRISGHIHAGSANICHLLEESIKDWDIFHSDGFCIYSHAGFSRQFLLDTQNTPIRLLKEARGLNNPLNRVGYHSGGDSLAPSPIWARPSELDGDSSLPPSFAPFQVVGHTPVDTITQRGNLIICDTMSQYPDGSFIGDKSLLLIEDKHFYHFNPFLGRKYELHFDLI